MLLILQEMEIREHRREQLLLRGSLEMGETLPEDLQNILMLVVALLLK